MVTTGDRCKICALALLTAKRVWSFSSIWQDEALHLITSIKDLAVAGESINQTENLLSYTISALCRAAIITMNLRNNVCFNEQFWLLMLDMFSAGNKTSSATVKWAISEVIRNPRVMVKAQSEIQKACMGKKTAEESDIQELKYLIIKETLRIHSPLLIPRECRDECEIDGYIIPVKTRVMVNAWAIGSDPESWDDPERRRIRPGISFGLANVGLPLALLLHHFDWKLPNGLKSSEIDMTESVGLNGGRANNLCLLATMYDPSLDMPTETL
nr:premnaspirodiene oxygenase-like [Coffea arabica]